MGEWSPSDCRKNRRHTACNSEAAALYWFREPNPGNPTSRVEDDSGHNNDEFKRQWFAEIVARTKRIEYREVKPYWTSRFRRVNTPFRLVLRDGMTRPNPVLRVRIDRITTSPIGKLRKGTYALHIGSVLKVEHWDRRSKRPKSRLELHCQY